jgi:hypothetical protein
VPLEMRVSGQFVTFVAAVGAALAGWFYTRVGLPSASSEGPAIQPVEENPVEGVGIDAVQRSIATNVPGFGGFYIDPETKRLQVWLTDPSRDSGAVRDSLRRELGDHPLYHESKIDFRQGQYGFLVLQDWHEEVTRSILPLPGVVYTDNHERINRIQIG